MAAKVTIALKAPADALAGYSAGAVLRLHSSATEDGVYANVAAIAIVATTFSYEYWDNAGDTTTWYRWRVENAGATETGEWSDPFQGADPALSAPRSGAYADVDDLLLEMRQAITDTRWLANAQTRLVEASRELEKALGGYQFFRGVSQAIRMHGTGTCALHIHQGLVSVATVEIQEVTGGDWIALETDDWYLEGLSSQDFIADGEPYFHLQLEGDATYRRFPTVRRGVRLTGVPGWPAVPSGAKHATIAKARQLLAADTSLPGGPMGPEEFGSPVGADRWPRAFYDFVMAERDRFVACSL
jgi:hypothetical protein